MDALPRADATGGVRPGEAVLVRALVALRWAGLVPMAAVLVLRRQRLDRPVLAVAVAVVVVAVTVWVSVTARRSPGRLLEARVVTVELALAAVVLAADGWSFGSEHTFNTPALGAVWPLAAVMSAGLVAGPRLGAASGAAVTIARLVGAAAPAVQHGPPSLDDLLVVDGARLVPTASLIALYMVAGLGAGYLARLQRLAEDQIASSRAREEVARALHDGVLQTLALVQRRSTDPALSRLARDTDHDLRAFLAGVGGQDRAELAERLRMAVDRYAHQGDVTHQLLVDDGLERVTPSVAQALAGAVAEALANVAKHAGAHRVIVFAGPDELAGGVVVSVKDDGCGFDPSAVPADRGIARSVRARIEEVGGRLELRSAPGAGTEVRLWVP